MTSNRIKIRPDSLRVVFLEMKFEEKRLAVGTAFVATLSKGAQRYLITARHNLTGRHAETGEPLHNQCAIPNRLSVHFHRTRSTGEPVSYEVVDYELQNADGDNIWQEHPVLGSCADIAAMPIQSGDHVFTLPFDLSETAERQTGPADPVSVIGFPFGKSSGSGLPIWATGYMASEPSMDFQGQPTFLIDCRGREGQSGAPVISFRSDGMVGHNQFQGAWTAATSDFLGLYCGRINDQSDLGLVWKGSAIVELLSGSA